jgi:hypothetical protein
VTIDFSYYYCVGGKSEKDCEISRIKAGKGANDENVHSKPMVLR